MWNWQTKKAVYLFYGTFVMSRAIALLVFKRLLSSAKQIGLDFEADIKLTFHCVIS